MVDSGLLLEATKSENSFAELKLSENWRNKKAHEALELEFCFDFPCIGVRWRDSRLVIAAPKEMHEILEKKLKITKATYELIEGESAEILDLLSLLSKQETSQNSDYLPNQEFIGQDSSVANVLDQIITKAVLSRASDIHLEPFETVIHIRIRVDGKLQPLTELPISFGPALSSRIKVLAQLNIVERRRPQDGQFNLTIGDRRIDIRVSTAATIYGEKCVLRLLDERRPLVSLSKLGMRKDQLEPFNRAILSVNGLILAAGPTGSGKTTTLHSALRAASSPDKNVTTIEDPVEYVVANINQIPVSEANGTGFAVQLRAILRQDPDVILVGETRDAETARISIQAALTGHLVLTSIHATDAVGAVYRLMQMDIEPHLVASALRAVISQRLLRRICRFCYEEYKPTKQELITLESRNLKPALLARGQGCVFCNGTGFRDRVAAYQFLGISENLAELISSRPDPVVFRKKAINEGLRTISDEALNLALDCVTSLDEALEFIDRHE